MCSLASQTCRRTGLLNCCHGIGTIRTCRWSLELGIMLYAIRGPRRVLSFDLLYVLIIVRLARRDLVWINVTPHPTAEWIARQITEAFPWNEVPRYLIRDRDRVYGAAVMRRLRA